MNKCPQCDTPIVLGRVFCAQCGAKLDLSATEPDLSRGSLTRVVRRFVGVALAVVTVVAVVVLCLAFWPRQDAIGESGTRVGGRRVQNQVEAITLLGEGQTLAGNFAERDINGYFEFFKPKKMKAKWLRVAVRGSSIGVRRVQRSRGFSLGPLEFAPTVSHDLLLVPSGASLVVIKASVGHLPLVGPARSIAVNAVYRDVSAAPDWAPLKQASKIETENGKIVVTVSR